MSPRPLACVMYTGGKDSCYSLHWTIYHGIDVACLLSLRPSGWESTLLHYPGIELVKLHSKALGIPLEYAVVEDSSVESEAEALSRLFSIARERYGASLVVSGALRSDYQRLFFSALAWRERLAVLAPLWMRNQEEYMRSLVREGFRVLVLSVQAYGLPGWLPGRILDEELVEEIIRRARRYGFNPAFEGGEAETLVLDAPLFKYRLRVEGRREKLGPDHYAYIVENAWLEEKTG